VLECALVHFIYLLNYVLKYETEAETALIVKYKKAAKEASGCHARLVSSLCRHFSLNCDSFVD